MVASSLVKADNNKLIACGLLQNQIRSIVLEDFWGKPKESNTKSTVIKLTIC